MFRKCQCLRHSLMYSFFRQVSIVNLSNELLLNIFRYYLDACPQFWPRLVHICRKWRHIVFTSQQALHLRLFCARGTPALKTLDCWPALPIVVQYGGAPSLRSPVLEDEDKIMVALKHSDRVSSISLTITSSLLEKLSAIERPFSELEDLVLLSRHRELQTLHSAFQWGPRLRTLHLTGFAVPELPGLLFPSTGLVDLQLHNIPKLGYFSPEAFVNALSGMAQLRTLSLHFLSTCPRDHLGSPPLSGERVVLPALTSLKYRGTSQYLDSVVARIDTPLLGDFDITFLCRPTMNTSQLGQFLSRIKTQKSHCRAEILFSQRTISISFNQPEAPARLKLQATCSNLAQQLSYMAQICDSLSTFLLRAESLRFGATQLPSGLDDPDLKEWLGLIFRFRGAKWVHLACNQPTNIILALCLRKHKAALPALHKLYVREHEPPYAPLQKAVASFVHSRRLSGQIICVEYERVRETGTTSVQFQFVSRTKLL
jgi:hypothetical protein